MWVHSCGFLCISGLACCSGVNCIFHVQMQMADLSDTWIFDCGWLVPLTPELFKGQLYIVVREGKSRIRVCSCKDKSLSPMYDTYSLMLFFYQVTGPFWESPILEA